MAILFWVLVIGHALDILGKLVWLATEDYPKRTPRDIATGAAINTVLLIWILLVWR